VAREKSFLAAKRAPHFGLALPAAGRFAERWTISVVRSENAQELMANIRR
jgi:hypothetical protein